MKPLLSAALLPALLPAAIPYPNARPAAVHAPLALPTAAALPALAAAPIRPANRLLTQGLIGTPQDVEAYRRAIEAAGWSVAYHENLDIKGGERAWWSARPARLEAVSSSPRTLPARVREGETRQDLHLVGTEAELDALFEALAAEGWRLGFLGHDGGWLAEPLYRVRPPSSR